MSFEISEEDLSLTLKEKLNFEYILQRNFIAIQNLSINPQSTLKDLQNAVMLFVNQIPSAWEDQPFRKAVKKARKKFYVDNRPKWCGTPMVNEDGLMEVEEIDHRKMLKAVTDLLSRKGMLNRKVYTETFTGNDFTTDSDIEKEIKMIEKPVDDEDE